MKQLATDEVVKVRRLRLQSRIAALKVKIATADDRVKPDLKRQLDQLQESVQALR